MEAAMADLSDDDKRVLFGDHYVEAQRDRAPAGSGAAANLRAREEADKMDNWTTWSIAIAIVSALIVLTNYFGAAFAYNPGLEIGAGIVFIAAVLLGIYSRRRKRSIMARAN